MSLLSFQCRHRYNAGFELDAAFESDHSVTSLFGPSGSGKTSVLSMIAGFVRPQSAKIQLGDRPLVDTAKGIHIRTDKRRIGFVFQDHLLFPHLTVESNLRYGQRRRRHGGRTIDFTRAVDVLELGPLLSRHPRNLSGGERQRVALGRALLSGPELLLMDEPLASLDAALKSRVLTYLDRVIREWSIPTLFVSHGQGEVRRLAGWVVVLECGKVIACGKPEDALSQQHPLRWKDASGPMNLLRIGHPSQRDGHWIGRLGDQELHLPPLEQPIATPLFVQFSPSEVTLSRQDVTGLSVRNQLHGQIRQIVDLGDRVFVAVDVGQIIWSEVTHDAAVELELRPGTGVTCLIKTQTLQLLS